MEFPKTNADEDKIVDEEVFRIFGEMRKKHSNNNIRDMDIILNTFCGCLIRLARVHVQEKDWPHFIELVEKILKLNLSGNTHEKN